jgi:CheY-like chemotaxis protein
MGMLYRHRELRMVVSESDSYNRVILVIADDGEIRDGIETLLGADGYRVYPARNEEEAIETATQHQPDLILVSLGESAEAVTASADRVRALAGLGDAVPIVMFSISTVDEGAEVELRKNLYATRPDDFNQLRRMLARLLGPAPSRC